MNVKNLSIPVLILLFILWITPGLVVRDPWKADEPYTVGIVNSMIHTGDLVVPSLTGEPFLEKPPIFFITAAAFGRLLSPPLELHAAARLATGLYIFLALLFFALSAQELYGGDYRTIAVLLLLGCVNLQIPAHKLITDDALFAGFSMALYGFALAGRRRGAAGFWIGTGTGIGFLSKGLIAPGALSVTAIVLPVLFRQWRRKDYAFSLAIAFAAALPWLVIWPAALYLRSPDFFVYWFWDQNFGRFLGFNKGSVGFNAAALDSHSFFIVNLVWLAWPVVLLAFWSLWHFRRSWREHPAYRMPLVSFLVILAVLSASATNRVLYALPMLLPITLIAVPGSSVLPLKAKVILNRASVLIFGGIAIAAWAAWLAMMTGHPAAIARKLYDFQPDYVPTVNLVLVAVAFLYSMGWLFAVTRVFRAPDNAILNWTFGVILAWCLAMTLWLPVLETGSSYRSAFTSLKKSLPAEYKCVASVNLGESERAMLEYFAGLQPRRIEVSGIGNCDLLLEVQGSESRPPAGSGWEKIWEFKRPSLHPKDIFTLYELKAAPK